MGEAAPHRQSFYCTSSLLSPSFSLLSFYLHAFFYLPVLASFLFLPQRFCFLDQRISWEDVKPAQNLPQILRMTAKPFTHLETFIKTIKYYINEKEGDKKYIQTTIDIILRNQYLAKLMVFVDWIKSALLI